MPSLSDGKGWIRLYAARTKSNEKTRFRSRETDVRSLPSPIARHSLRSLSRRVFGTRKSSLRSLTNRFLTPLCLRTSSLLPFGRSLSSSSILVEFLTVYFPIIFTILLEATLESCHDTKGCFYFRSFLQFRVNEKF